jgi:glycyl-tRNA synthetase beta chain
MEIGCEEIPAAWLPGLTGQLRERVAFRLKELRLSADAPVEAYSTPRRLTARVEKLLERQAEHEETVTGPPVTAAFTPDGEPTPAAVGFARKYGVEIADLARVETSRGQYLAYHKRDRSRTTVDVLPELLALALRDLSFPKSMHWDAELEDGRGELLFGRPIRWILFLYGGRVVPFAVRRSVLAQSPQVQEVRSGAVTYGHRFLATSGRPGRAIKVRTFDEYRSKLAEHFVVLDRAERRDRIARDLDLHARRLGARVRPGTSQAGLLDEVPDLVEYPTVVAGTFAPDFLELPEEVLTTAMIHHQHFFPVVDESGRLKPAFLAVTNTEPDNARAIARNAERVLAARLRDAQFFWAADRRNTLESRSPMLDSVLFHKRLGSYKEKADRIDRLARRLAEEALGSVFAAGHAGRAARLAKCDLVTDMVKEFPELQGTMGGIYARHDGEPEEVWRAIYHHYLPTGPEPTAPPSREDLGAAAVSWAAVSLADKLDTLVAMFTAGEAPTGSRDPYGLRRLAQGVLRVLIDLPELTGLGSRPSLGLVVAAAEETFSSRPRPDAEGSLWTFLRERLRYVLEQRGFDIRNVRAVTAEPAVGMIRPLDARLKLEALPEFTVSDDFQRLATAFKRVRNIARELPDREFDALEASGPALDATLDEPAERTLLAELTARGPAIAALIDSGADFRRAFAIAAGFGPPVDAFFTDVFVMVDDQALRTARLRLLKRLESVILRLADVSELVTEA